MTTTTRATRQDRRMVPGVEGLEGKQLLSGSSISTPEQDPNLVTLANTHATIQTFASADGPSTYLVSGDVKVVADPSGGYDIVLKGSNGATFDHIAQAAGKAVFEVFDQGVEKDYDFTDHDVETTITVSEGGQSAAQNGSSYDNGLDQTV